METSGGGENAAKPLPSQITERRPSRRLSEPAKPICKKGSCVIDVKETNKLECSECEKSFHYRCTGLPVFQIHHFLHTKKYKKFICESCTLVADHLNTVIPSPPPEDPGKQVHDLMKTIKEKQLEVDTLAKTNRMLQSEIKELMSKNTDIQVSLNKEKAKHVTLQNKSKELKNGIAEKVEKIESLEKSLKNNTNIDSLTDILAKRFDEVESKLIDSLQIEVIKNQKKIEDQMNEFFQKSYAAAVGDAEPLQKSTGSVSLEKNGIIHVPDIRSIIREEENERLADETDKKRRTCNFIVHGVKENVIPENQGKQSKKMDKDFVNALISDVGMSFNIKQVFRLGADAANDRIRPIKVVLDCENDKNNLLKNLRKLKGKDKYKGVSVTDDYTIKDRSLLKEWAEKAKLKNFEEPEESLFEWKVRGCPKNGLSLKKFRKRDL